MEYSSEEIVNKYIDDVLSDKISVCKLAKLAVKRHVSDIKEGHKRGLFFDKNSAQRAVDFFQFLRHYKGEWAGQVFTLEPWQTFLNWVLFGWKRENGYRRFRTAYISIPRKNGKTIWAAGVGLYLFIADNEPGAECYCVATRRDQARIAFDAAMRMIKMSDGLSGMVDILRSNMNIESTASKFEPLSSDYNSLDGLNTHGGICDELHAWPDGRLWDVIETSTGSRRQSLLIAITTAGFNKESICYVQHSYAEKILNGLVEDDSYFALIHQADDGDDWTDEATWRKANPNYGISIYPDDIERQCKQAQELPTKQNAFKRLRLNMWTESETRWISEEQWNLCNIPVDPDGLKGRICYGGLDLSSTQDIAGYILVFPPEVEGDKFQILCRFFIPQDNMQKRAKKDRVPYDVWVRQGFMQTTPGNIIDYNFIKASIFKDAKKYQLKEMAFDPWNATQISLQLAEEDIQVVDFRQGFKSMSPATKELEVKILNKELAHGGNPVLAWMMSNVMMAIDPAGNIKPDKSKSREKIDGVVMLCMALDRAVRREDPVFRTAKPDYEVPAF